MVENVIVWASIPVTDLARAKKFYAHVTGRPVEGMVGFEEQVATIQGPEGEYVVSADMSTAGTPGQTGAIPYLNAYGDIQGMMRRVVEAGGTVLDEPKFMGDMVGWIAFFLDSEGNRMGAQQPA